MTRSRKMKSTFLLLLIASVSYAVSTSLERSDNLLDYKPSIFIDNKEIKLDKYFHSSDLEALLVKLNQEYTNIMDLIPIGVASQKDLKTLWAARITSKDGVPLKPKVKLVANIHGDETVGYALLVSLIQYLLYSYKVNKRIQEMVQKTDIYIIPTINPDRLYCLKGMGECPNPPKSDDHPGYNGFDVDLDRDFLPEYFENYDNRSERKPQRETRYMIEFIKQNHFVLSASLKGGAIVANYPFDHYHHKNGRYIGKLTPDNKFFMRLAKDYARRNAMMKNGTACNESFPHGITNGIERIKEEDAYHNDGGMQDANYLMSNCFEISLYLSCIKYPPASELPEYWYANLDSMLKFIENAHRGVFGYVHDKRSKPVKGAIITVEGNMKYIKVTPSGEYWRLLPPGEYNVTARAFPYITEKKSVSLNNEKLVRHDFVLKRFNVYGTVKDKKNTVISHAVITIKKFEGSISNSTYRGYKQINLDSNGIFCSHLVAGSKFHYHVTARAEGFKKSTCEIIIETRETTERCDFKLSEDDSLSKIDGQVKDIIKSSEDDSLPKIDGQVKDIIKSSGDNRKFTFIRKLTESFPKIYGQKKDIKSREDDSLPKIEGHVKDSKLPEDDNRLPKIDGHVKDFKSSEDDGLPKFDDHKKDIKSPEDDSLPKIDGQKKDIKSREDDSLPKIDGQVKDIIKSSEDDGLPKIDGQVKDIIKSSEDNRKFTFIRKFTDSFPKIYGQKNDIKSREDDSLPKIDSRKKNIKSPEDDSLSKIDGHVEDSKLPEDDSLPKIDGHVKDFKSSEGDILPKFDGHKKDIKSPEDDSLPKIDGHKKDIIKSREDDSLLKIDGHKKDIIQSSEDDSLPKVDGHKKDIIQSSEDDSLPKVDGHKKDIIQTSEDDNLPKADGHKKDIIQSSEDDSLPKVDGHKKDIIKSSEDDSLPKIYGQVKDEDNRPVPGATVDFYSRWLVPLNVVYVDSTGMYSWHSQPGIYKLIAKAPGYISSEQKVNFNETKMKIDFYIKPYSTEKPYINTTTMYVSFNNNNNNVSEIVNQRNMSFLRHKVKDDGNCLFRAVSLFLYKTQKEHKKVREQAVSYVRGHWIDLKDYVVTTNPNQDAQTYCHQMEQDKTYGTSVEILAMSEIHRINSNVFTEETKPKGANFYTNKKPTVISKNEHQINMYLLLYGNIESGHFELLEPIQQQSLSVKPQKKKTK